MDFIIAPLIVGIITLGIYKLFELFARRRERITVAEKLTGAELVEYLKCQPVQQSVPAMRWNGDWALRFGCLLSGMGLGLLVSYLIWMLSYVELGYNIRSMIIGGSVLFFGGLGLIVAYVIEYRQKKARGE